MIDSMFDQMNPDRWSSSLSSYEELILPKDPDTKANWIDFGIICTELKDVRCALCSRGCCKTSQAGYTGKDHRTPRDVRDAARKAYDRYKISATSLHKKLSTMKTCTFCARTVCGVCSSLCPDEWCSSVNCSECNPRMWESCAWHQEETLSYQISKEEEVLRRASASMGNGTVEAALRRITSDI